MLNINRIFICGRLTATPELKMTSPGGRNVCSFDIACNANKNSTYFFTVVAWETRAEFIAKNFSKGSPIFIEGELVQRKYTTKDNRTASVVEIRALDVKFVETLDEKNARLAGAAPASAPTAEPATDELYLNVEEGLPF